MGRAAGNGCTRLWVALIGLNLEVRFMGSMFGEGGKLPAVILLRWHWHCGEYRECKSVIDNGNMHTSTFGVALKDDDGEKKYIV